MPHQTLTLLPAFGALRMALVVVGVFTAVGTADADSWPQFRGPNASGRPNVDAPLPHEIGPKKNLVWATDLPAGHSSPVVVADRIFLTAERGQHLVTLALERASGKLLWERDAGNDHLEEIHHIGSHAQASPAADAEVGSSRVDLQACKLEYSIVSPK